MTAADGAAQGAALLKNDKALLPLKGTSSVAVIGPNSDLSSKIASYYGPGNVCDGKFYTLIDAVKAHAKSVVSIKGVPDVKSSNTSGIADAVTMAKSVDVVILAIGTDLSWARKGPMRIQSTAFLSPPDRRRSWTQSPRRRKRQSLWSR